MFYQCKTGALYFLLTTQFYNAIRNSDKCFNYLTENDLDHREL